VTCSQKITQKTKKKKNIVGRRGITRYCCPTEDLNKRVLKIFRRRVDSGPVRKVINEDEKCAIRIKRKRRDREGLRYSSLVQNERPNYFESTLSLRSTYKTWKVT